MDKLVDIIAPRSWRDATLKTIAFLAMINTTDYLVTGLSGHGPLDPFTDSVDTTFIAMPFVMLFLAVLNHQRRLQRRLAALASTDQLTGLPNRRDFLERARTAIADGGEGTLLLLDADHFKSINDRWGHSAGDAALTAIAAHLRRSLRPGDTMGRLGGEEFGAYLPGADCAEARMVGERLCGPIGIAGHEALAGLRITLSAGAAPVEPGQSLDRALANADRALYRAKAAGRARMHLWTGEAEAA